MTNSTITEERVVGLRFDNKDFAKSVRNTMSLLDRLHYSVDNLKGAGNSVLFFANQIKSITFDPLARGCQMGIGKIMALTAALTGVSNVADEVYHKMTTLIKSMSTDQISAGWTKYADYTSSMQTIMSATKMADETDEEAMKRVNTQMERLLWFTDETSYNLTDMTSNIGKFVSQGVGLEESVTAMEGIALWAAAAGQKSAEASRAMYNLSQSLGAGSVQLKDWMSIENANMATKEFKELAIQAGLAQGTLKKVGNEVKTLNGKVVTIEKFRETLQHDWLDTKTLMTVLKQYGEYAELVRAEVLRTGKLASQVIQEFKENGTAALYPVGAAALEAGQAAITFADAIGSVKDAVSTQFLRIFQAIFGNYLRAKELWTTFANDLWDVFAGPVDKIATAFEHFAETKEIEKVWKNLYSIWEKVYEIFEKIETVFQEVFPNAAWYIKNFIDGTNKISINLRNFLNNKVLGNANIWANLQKVFEGAKSSLNIIKNLLDTIYSRIISKFTSKTDSFLDAIMAIAGKIGDLLVQADDYVQKTDIFNNFFDNIERVINTVFDALRNIKNVIFTTIDKIETKLLHRSKAGMPSELTAGLDEMTQTLFTFDNLADAVINSINGITDALAVAIPWFIKFWYWIKDTFKDAKTFFGTLAGMIKAIFDEIKKVLKPLFHDAGSVFDEFRKNFSLAELFNNSKNPIDFFNKLLEKIKEFSGISKEYLEGLFKDKGATTILDKFLVLIVDAVENFLDRIEPLLPRIMELNKKLFGTDNLFDSAVRLSTAILLFIAAINILKTAFGNKRMEERANNEDNANLIATGNFIQDLINLPFNITQLMKSIKDIVNPFKSMANELKQIGKKAFIVSVIFLIINSITALTASMLVIALLPWKKVLMAFGIISALLGGIIGVFAIINKISKNKDFSEKKALSFGIFMTLFATAMLEMAGAVAILSIMPTSDHVAGAVVAIAGLLAGMAYLMILLADAAKNEGQMISAGVAIVLLAKAVKIVATAMVKISHIKEEELAQATITILALVGLMGTLEILAAAIKKQQGGTGAIMVMGISCIAMASSILIAAFAMKKIADIPVEDLKAAGIAMGIIFAALSMFIAGASGMAKLLSSGKGSTGNLVVIVVMVGIMAGVMTAVGAALASVAKVSYDGKRIIQIAGAMAGLMAAIAVLLILGANLQKANIGAIAAFGGIISVVMLNISLIGIALGNLAKNVDPASLWNVVGAVSAIMGAIILIVGVAAFVIQAVGKTSFGKGFIGALFAVAGIIAIIITAISFAAYAASQLINSLIALTNLSEEARARMTAGTGALVSAIAALWQAVVDGLDKALTETLSESEIHEALARFFEKALTAITGILPKVKSFISRVVKEVSAYIREDHETIKETLEIIFNDFLDLVLGLFEKYGPRLINDIFRFLNSIFMNIDTLFKRWTPVLKEDLINLSKAILAVIWQTKVGIVNSVVNGILYLLIRLKTFSLQFGLMAMEIVYRFVIAFLASVREKAPEVLDELAITVIALINGLADTIDEHHKELEDAVANLLDSISTAAKSWFTNADMPGGKLFNLGYNIAAGIVKGLNYGKQIVAATMTNLANSGVIKSFTTPTGINSPSTVFEGFGKYITQGFTNGITKNEGSVSTVMSNLGSIVKNSFTDTFGDPKELLSNLGNGLKEGITGLISKKFNLEGLFGDLGGLNIVLTPELDLSTLESQAGGISSLFGQQQIDAVAGSFSVPDTGLDSVSMTNKMDEMMKKMEDYALAQSYNSHPTNVNVTLEGDAKKMLKVLKTEGQKQSLATGIPSTI